MGCNFYWGVEGGLRRDVILPTGETYHLSCDSMDPQIHIGKRSAAGLYCWDCKLTLCRGGVEAIHYGNSDWYGSCPRCGMSAEDEGTFKQTVSMELGFTKSSDLVLPKGVASCSSFSWAQNPGVVKQTCIDKYNDFVIEDEYGRPYTGMEFVCKVLGFCPVQSTNSIGTYFC